MLICLYPVFSPCFLNELCNPVLLTQSSFRQTRCFYCTYFDENWVYTTAGGHYLQTFKSV